MTPARGSTRTRAVLLAALLWPAAARAGLSANAEKLLDEGIVSLYNLDYDKSREAFHKIIELEPDNPFGYLFESGGIWWQSSQEYGLFKDTPTLQGVFERDVELAIKKAAPLTKSKDPAVRADALFASGMAYGTLGQWSLMRGHWLKACGDGRKAVKELKNCIKVDPEYHDAQLGLGVYDYQAARLGPVLKLGAMLCGARGNEKKGLEMIRLAMERGRYGSRQAREFLFSIYLVDRREPQEAYAILQRLRQDFPESPYFQFLAIALRHRLGETDASIKEGKEFFLRFQNDLPTLRRKWLTLVCGMEGSACLSPQDLRAANAWLTHAIEADAADEPSGLNKDGWLSTIRLLRGYAWDALGKHEYALKDYAWVLAHPDFSDNHARARHCSGKPCGTKALLAYFRDASRS
jgi:tetratricopeptide (TPR) repeat protein